MKKIPILLSLVIACASALAQSKREMPFTSSSPNANKLLRSAWVNLADFKIEDGNNTIQQVLKEDPACGMAYASLFPSTAEEGNENLKKAADSKLSADERMLLEGILARIEKRSPQAYFQPLMKKYPSDDYLHFLIIFNSEPDEAIELGESMIKRKPKFAPVHNLLGYLYMNKNDMATAQVHFDQYISLRPDLANPYDSKADFMMRAGKIAEAIPLYDKAASMGMVVSATKAEDARAQLKFPKPTDADKASINEIIQSGFVALTKNDVNGILKDYSGQSVEILDNQWANVGLPNIQSRISEMLKSGGPTKDDFTMEPVTGAGPIAVAYGKSDYVWKDAATGEETALSNNAIFIFRKNIEGQWKILVDHFYNSETDPRPISAQDRASLTKILTDWEKAAGPGETLSTKSLEGLALLYSPQAIEIYPNLRSNIGMANLRRRWEYFIGAKMEVNKLRPQGIEGTGRRAVAWGIGTQNFYPKDSRELVAADFPWAIMFTKEKDDVWRILAFHWGED